MITASMLFAGSRHVDGGQRCYYCGAPCDESCGRDKRVGDTFTNRDIVKFPASAYVCAGCYYSTGDGEGDLPMIDGSIKAFTTPRGMAPRMYSWFLTTEGNFAFTKAHIAIVRKMISNADLLPDPPFAWILADSGQKQLIFRAPVAYGKERFPVMLEDQVIDISPDGLRDRLEIASSISRKIGKPVLTEKIHFNAYAQAEKAGLNTDYLDEWIKVQHEPLSKLAAWLAPPKEKE